MVESWVRWYSLSQGFGFRGCTQCRTDKCSWWTQRVPFAYWATAGEWLPAWNSVRSRPCFQGSLNIGSGTRVVSDEDGWARAFCDSPAVNSARPTWGCWPFRPLLVLVQFAPQDWVQSLHFRTQLCRVSSILRFMASSFLFSSMLKFELLRLFSSSLMCLS